MSFIAEYPGECGDCGEEVKGTEVQFSAFGEGLFHVTCPEPKPPLPTCPVHNIELPLSGVCDDC